jgi:hypothetical protein
MPYDEAVTRRGRGPPDGPSGSRVCRSACWPVLRARHDGPVRHGARAHRLNEPERSGSSAAGATRGLSRFLTMRRSDYGGSADEGTARPRQRVTQRAHSARGGSARAAPGWRGLVDCAARRRARRVASVAVERRRLPGHRDQRLGGMATPISGRAIEQHKGHASRRHIRHAQVRVDPRGSVTQCTRWGWTDQIPLVVAGLIVVHVTPDWWRAFLTLMDATHGDSR